MLHVPRNAPFSDWPQVCIHLHSISGLVASTSLILQNQEEETESIKREAKRKLGRSFEVCLLQQLRSVLFIHCLFNKSSAGLSCN